MENLLPMSLSNYSQYSLCALLAQKKLGPQTASSPLYHLEVTMPPLSPLSTEVTACLGTVYN